MRKIWLLACSLAAMLAAGAVADRATAMPASAALGVAADNLKTLEQIRWHDHRYGHAWAWRHRHYWGFPPSYGGLYPYGFWEPPSGCCSGWWRGWDWR
jgi:hypothetical protein